jgi:hypothetical protein
MDRNTHEWRKAYDEMHLDGNYKMIMNGYGAGVALGS